MGWLSDSLSSRSSFRCDLGTPDPSLGHRNYVTGESAPQVVNRRTQTAGDSVDSGDKVHRMNESSLPECSNAYL